MRKNHPAVEAALARGAADQRERRARFAAAALTGTLAYGDADRETVSEIADACIRMADALLAALDRKPEAHALKRKRVAARLLGAPPREIVGTHEFAQKYEAILRLLEAPALVSVDARELVKLRAVIDAAILEAYSEGFNEGLCK